MDSGWPKRADGSNMTMGEMTPEQRRHQMKLAAERAKKRFENPAMADKIAAAIDGGTIDN